ncbi:unnamed protein product [Moneuplotes crassus]|uniref:Trifunctional nucleotide phosphoesterase protein YfkN n=1 Tax=Euplotes crassus TaxID=5936 RepID=A0AAD1U9Z9_EUPCR|nr:unnamed protein product [Moneuplotes crassus]
MESERTMHILHFNDVYNLQPRKKEPIGGAARFLTATKPHMEKNPLVLFSGDIYSPSKLGQTMKGTQMLPFFERFKIDVACAGNHDLDYGVDRFIELKNKSDFPWLLTNVLDSHTNEPLGETLDHIILEHEGIKIGIIGLAESEWLDSIVSMEEDDYVYEDFIKSANKWCPKLREQGCELIIALTHMRMPNDKKLASKVPDLDIILGGHDHMSANININDIMLCKSGTDFREFSMIKIRMNCSEETLNSETHEDVINHKKKIIMSCEKTIITSEFEPEETLQAVADGFWEELNEKMDRPAGVTGVELDARFAEIRCRETNIANFVADVVRHATGTDCAIFNSGSFRMDSIIPKGVFKWKDIDTLFPIVDETLIIRVPGATLLEALENGVSEVPKLEGRFPAISGIRIKYDPERPKMDRIVDCTINGEPIHMKKLYSVTTKEFVYKGKDGYECLKDCELVADEEDLLSINMALINFLKLMVRKNNRWFSDKKGLVQKALDLVHNTEKDFETKDENGEDLRYQFYRIYPKVDGRITDLSQE